MRTHLTIGLLAASIFLTAGAALAQSLPDVVNVNMTIAQPSLFDTSKRDIFKGSVDDKSGTTSFEVICSAGASGTLGFGRVDETCAVSGSGIIKNPNNPSQTAARVAYSGGFIIEAKQDGYTNATTLLANYLRVGSAGAENSSFKGNLVMMPENPSASAQALRDRLLRQLTETTTGTEAVKFNTQIDSIRFDNFTVPHVGLGNSQPCSWTGDLIYAYANEAWQGAFTVKCGDATYKLEGNMPLVEAAAGSDHQEEYLLNLVVPGEGGGDPFAAADPFATVNGIVGTMRLKNSGRNADGIYENVVVTGELTGTGVPLELTRGFGQIMLIFGRTFYGA